eukprot:SAG22_NODE_20452_length_265_cov_1.240964_1_plen_30_part_01
MRARVLAVCRLHVGTVIAALQSRLRALSHH